MYIVLGRYKGCAQKASPMLWDKDSKRFYFVTYTTPTTLFPTYDKARNMIRKHKRQEATNPDYMVIDLRIQRCKAYCAWKA